MIGIPAEASASILSVVTSIFSASVSAAEEDAPANSQKMALLEAPAPGVAPLPADVLTDDDALVPTLSPGDADLRASQTRKIASHVIESGDTVASIAKQHGVSVNTILWANNLSRTSKLIAGKSLVILPISGVQHKVRSGDTLQSIAKAYKGDVDEIVAYNHIEANKLKVGEIVVIPDGEFATPPKMYAKVAAPKIKTALSSQLAGVAGSISPVSFLRPIKGGVRTQGIHGWNGVDLADACGTPIYAAAAGTVTISKADGGWNGGYGNYVVIDHADGSQSLYSHMQDATVSEGGQVGKGEEIGTIGATGKVHGVTGCHVHFEIRNGPTNPF